MSLTLTDNVTLHPEAPGPPMSTSPAYRLRGTVKCRRSSTGRSRTYAPPALADPLDSILGRRPPCAAVMGAHARGRPGHTRPSALLWAVTTPARATMTMLARLRSRPPPAVRSRNGCARARPPCAHAATGPAWTATTDASADPPPRSQPPRAARSLNGCARTRGRPARRLRPRPPPVVRSHNGCARARPPCASGSAPAL